MSVIIGADIVPTTLNIELFVQGDAVGLVGEPLFNVLQAADYRICNLEVPLTDQENPIDKNGPNLIAPTSTVNGMKALGIDLFTLANNHIMDQGEKGFMDTAEALKDAGIERVGADTNLEEASHPFYFEVKGKKYGIYACAEHEYSIAGTNKPGANPFDPLESPYHVAAMKKVCNYVIVLYHGGKEHYRYPSPHLQKVCRKLVEKGADLVVCQHSHCIGCMENYRHGTIVYGQGNFIFRKKSKDNEYWNTGLLIQIDNTGKIDFIPIEKNGDGIRLAEGEKGKYILKAFKDRSEEIKDPGAIISNYRKLANEFIPSYLLCFSGLSGNFFFRVANKLSKRKMQIWISKRIKKKYGIEIRNYAECEAHRELLIEGLK